jgi:glycosyltransferase involved in cell wall biosynthesis
MSEPTEPTESTDSGSGSEIRYSFLTTNYNKADVLERSLRSMLAALPESGELIVVDGDSTDGSVEGLRALGARDDRLRVVVSPSNLGEGRQVAFERARGGICVQHLDTDREYVPALRDLLEAFEELENEYPDLVLCTLDSLYVSRPGPIREAGGWPPLGRVEERVFVERLCRSGAALRILPVSLSRELPTADTVSVQARARKWRLTARDLLRVGFPLRALLRYNHRRFPLSKALLADLFSVLGAYDGREQEPIAIEPGAPRGPEVVESWQEVLRHRASFFPDGEDAILSPTDISVEFPEEAWIDLDVESANTPKDGR